MVIAVALLPSVILFLAAAGMWRAHLYELRWVVAVCVAVLCAAARRDSLLWLAILLTILILFNPLHPFYFPHTTMRILEFVAAVCLLVGGLARL
jgi:uncharacterized protein DUF6804